MMDTFLVEYYTKDGRKVGMQISAYTAQDAIRYAEKFPDFYNLSGYPAKVSS